MPVDIRADELVEEIHSFANKLGQSIKNLAEMGEIDVGVSEKEAVYEEDKLILYRYKPLVESKNINPVPVLINYALVNRPYMADLQEDRSLVRGLLLEGLDVYLIDWGYPDGSDRYLTLDDYINGYIDRCVDTIRDRSDQQSINILGICQGGAFSLCYASLHPEKVRNLVTTVTPVDFQTPGDMLSHLASKVDVDLAVDALGNIPGTLLNDTFVSLKPLRLSGQKYLDMLNALENPETAKNFMRMEKWIFDSPDQAGEAYRQFVKDFYQNNRLIKGEVVLGGQTVSLNNVTMPVLNIYASADHLVPPAASIALEKYVGSNDYSALEFPGGHIGIYVSGKAMKLIPPSVASWLGERI